MLQKYKWVELYYFSESWLEESNRIDTLEKFQRDICHIDNQGCNPGGNNYFHD
jgi:hypothetical protein